MKSLLAATAALSLVTATGTLPPRNADAAIAMMGGPPGLLLTAVLGGIALTGAATCLTGMAVDAGAIPFIERDDGWVMVATGGAAAVVGAVILDEEGQASLRFSSLSAESAAQAGLTASERLAFNSNLDEINEIAESASQRVMATQDGSPEHVRALILEETRHLDPEADSGLRKVAAYDLSRLRIR